ncbi:hypothetical protein DPMN_125800 [Dreissena polymorpha]|uniref:Uncharacterized protein n=1 Tax=Dreissena polymorpha TaxID=45954 RepID=A0A9D4GVU3_DREPO|nr:hypothetical protein DPMN_125800 [Dreissena polymorpha]
MASLDVTSRRPKTQNGFPSTLSVLSTAVLKHSHYLYRSTARSLGLHLCPRSVPSVLYAATSAAPCSRLSWGYVVKPLSTYGQLPFRLAILLSSWSQRNQRKTTSGSRDEGTQWISKAARRSSTGRPSKDDVVNTLSTYR